MKALLLAITALNLFANPLDTKLSDYIEKFKFGVPKTDSKKIEALYELGKELFFSKKLSLSLQPQKPM